MDIAPTLTTPPRGTPRADLLYQRAQQLESAFLAEMLSLAGLGAAGGAFGGGAGEAQFASFLRQAQADQIVSRGGVGLAEHLFRAMEGAADAG